MIDVNNYFLTKENILKFLNEFEIYEKYLDGQKVVLNKNLNSTITEDTNPSLRFFIGKSGELCFVDFRIGVGDFVKYIQLKFNLNFYEAMQKIVFDFGIESYFKLNEAKIILKENKENIFESFKKNNFQKPLIKVKVRKWENYDIDYWKQYGISIETLEKFEVYPISYYELNSNLCKAEKISYVFLEKKDNILTYKIYQPKSKSLKWISSNDFSVWDGWNLLPETSENLIITKSRKDCMFIYENCKIPVTCLQNEKAFPKEKIMNSLKERFKNIFILYDNDFNKERNWGQEGANKLINQYSFLKNIKIPDEYMSKDPSDLAKNLSVEFSKNFILNEIKLNEKCI